MLLLDGRSLRNGIGPILLAVPAHLRICVRKAKLCVLLAAITSIKLGIEVHAHVALPPASSHTAKALLSLDAKTMVRLSVIITVNRALIAPIMDTSVLRVCVILREKAAFDFLLLRLAIVDVSILGRNSLGRLVAPAKPM